MAGRMRWAVVPSLAVVGGLALVAGSVAVPADAATTVAVATSSVNIRTGPTTTAKIIGGLVRGQRIGVTGTAASGWVKVRFNRGTAYLYGSYLNRTGKNLPAGPTSIGSGSKITTGTLNVRSGPGTTYGVVGTLAEGTRVTTTRTAKSGFAQFRYGSSLRWASMAYLARFTTTTSTRPPVATPTPAPTPSNRGAVALAFAKKQLGKPYKFGAEGPNSYDCSGLAQASWAAAGVAIPRVTTTQFKFGTPVAKANLKPGDLVFFYGPSPSHVALYVGQGMVIHAPRPGKVVEYIKMSYMPYAGARRPG